MVIVSVMIEDLYWIFFRCEVLDKELVMVGWLLVLIIVVIVILMFLNLSSMIFDLVGYVWVGFGFVFGFVILLSLYWK